MSRSNIFLVITAAIVCVILLLCFYHRRSMPVTKEPVKVVNFEKETGFREEVATLDSIYLMLRNEATGKNGTISAEKEAEYNRRLEYIKRQYSGNSAPAILASKVIRNYQARMYLLKSLQSKTAAGQVEEGRLEDLVRRLEAENQDLKTENQMIQQALLNLP